MLALYLVGIPVWLFYTMYKNASSIDAAMEADSGVSLDAPEVAYKKEVLKHGQQFSYRWGFLFRGLKPDYYFTRCVRLGEGGVGKGRARAARKEGKHFSQ